MNLSPTILLTVKVQFGFYPQLVAVPEYVAPFCSASADKGYIVKHDSSIDIETKKVRDFLIIAIISFILYWIFFVYY